MGGTWDHKEDLQSLIIRIKIVVSRPYEFSLRGPNVATVPYIYYIAFIYLYVLSYILHHLNLLAKSSGQSIL